MASSVAPVPGRENPGRGIRIGGYVLEDKNPWGGTILWVLSVNIGKKGHHEEGAPASYGIANTPVCLTQRVPMSPNLLPTVCVSQHSTWPYIPSTPQPNQEPAAPCILYDLAGSHACLPQASISPVWVAPAIF